MSASPHIAARRQQQIEQLCASAIRAAAADPQLLFRGARLFRDRIPVPLEAPHLYPEPASATMASTRGAADAMALRLVHSDLDAHVHSRPEGRVGRVVFEMLEQFRTESLAAMPGTKRNLRNRFNAWTRDFEASGLTETAVGLLLYTVALTCRARVTSDPIPEPAADLIETTRGALSEAAGKHLAELRRSRHDQHNFAAPALRLATVIETMVDAAEDESGETSSQTSAARISFSLLVDFDDDDAGTAITAGTGAAATHGTYSVFSSQYDRVVPATSLVRDSLLPDYRRRVDQVIAEQKVNIARLSRQLELRLCAPVSSGWQGGQEEGLIDGARLSQLVCSPTERRLFQVERQQLQPQTTVSFLLDCSGSMKQHSESLAALIDVYVHALDRAGIASEVLGFTTGAWNGGRPAAAWKRAGSPASPGRLNEVNHIVFKDADTHWRRSRLSLAAMLKTSIFREGVAGEAVQWAARRLADAATPRKILVVVSDGAPADAATALANGNAYLDDHLQQVVRSLEAGETAVYGLGVGLDLSRYYSSSLILDQDRIAGPDSVKELLHLLGRRPGR